MKEKAKEYLNERNHEVPILNKCQGQRGHNSHK